MLEMWIEPVFTAHPTESTRRTILRKQQKIAQLLLGRLGLSRTAAETRTIWDRVRAEITSGWQTAENSRERLTVADEREHVLFFIAEILFQIVPIFYEEIEAALEQVYGPGGARHRPARDPALRLVGGRRHGRQSRTCTPRPFVRPSRASSRSSSIDTFSNARGSRSRCRRAPRESASRAELAARIENYSVLLPAAGSLSPARHDRMPYRVFLGQMMERLRATYEGRANHYENANDFLGDLNLIADSLRANKGEHAGLFQVRRLIRRVRTFGFHLATLDIRQNALAHRSVIAQGSAIPSGNRARARIVPRACAKRWNGTKVPPACSTRAASAACGCSKRWRTVAIATVRMRSAPTSSVRRSGVDDILSVLLLARWADTADRRSGDVPVDVAPLFESAGSARALRRRACRSCSTSRSTGAI